MNSYPHMCRDGHTEIGHADSEHEQCPLCRANGEIYWLREAIYWALGERGTFPEEPPPLAGKYRRRYHWRTELRRRAFGTTTDPTGDAAK